MVLAMSVRSCKTRVASKEVKNRTTEDWLNYLIALIRAIECRLENQYLAKTYPELQTKFETVI